MSRNFTVDAKLLLQLGRDSIKDHTTALVELVKNGYDADASIVEVEVNYNTPIKSIRISDNGTGMTSTEIEDNWLRIGYSEKKKSKFSPSGRRKTGEKGIGRIAADRIGSDLTMKTRSSDGNTNGLYINWKDFEVENQALEKIKIDDLINPEFNIPIKANEIQRNTGTELIISDLRNEWTIENINFLYNELSYFAPLIKPEDFQIRLINDIDNKYNKIVEAAILDAAEIQLELTYDGKKELVYHFKNRLNIEKNDLYELQLNEFIQQKMFKNLNCGPIDIKLYFFVRTPASLKNTNFSLKTVREYLNDNFGVKLYRDGVVVKPYGYSNNQFGQDWLDLDKRKSQDPAGLSRKSYKLNASNLVGIVSFSRDSNMELIDSAAREGLVENDAFKDLKKLVLGSVTLLENYRYELNKELNKSKKVDNKIIVEEFIRKIRLTLDNVIKDITIVKDYVNKKPDYTGKSLNETIQTLEEVKSDTEKTFEELLDEKRVMQGLATLGITSALFGHEIQNPIDTIIKTVYNLKLDIERNEFDRKKSIEKLIKINKKIRIISNWGDFALQRVQKDKRVKINRGVAKIIKEVVTQLEPVFDSLEIKIDFNNIEKLTAKTYPMDIESILINLLTNAYSAIPNSNNPRKVRIELINKYSIDNKKGMELIVADSGPGIPKQFVDRIWEPFWSTKTGDNGRQVGIGLGLTIVKSIVDELKGNIKIEKDIDLKGAKFIIWLPRK